MGVELIEKYLFYKFFRLLVVQLDLFLVLVLSLLAKLVFDLLRS